MCHMQENKNGTDSGGKGQGESSGLRVPLCLETGVNLLLIVISRTVV